MRKMSVSGLDFLKTTEAWSDVPYNDEAGIPTIGWGHRILPDESFNMIDYARGEDLLRRDLSTVEKNINALVKVPLSADQFDALASFAFNVGSNAFTTSTLLKKLNAGDYQGAAQEFPRWKYVTVNGDKRVSPGLLARRYKEQSMFIQGTQVV